MVQRIDVAVAGAGIVGLLAALAARRCGRTTMVFEARERSAPAHDRLFAVHAPAMRLLGDVGVRASLRAAVPVRGMRVRTPGGRWLKLDAHACGMAALAHIVSEREVAAALRAALDGAGVRIAYRAPLGAARNAAGAIELEAGAHRVRAKLLIGADGRNSKAAQLAQLAARTFRLPHDAVVATARFANQRRLAWQWLCGDQVLAALPGPQDSACLIWSRPPAAAQAAAGWDDRQFCAAVDRLCASQLGACRQPGARRAIALCETVRAPVAARVALVGDSFHSIHPLAGQGLALGCGDIVELGRALRGADPGCASALGRYRRMRLLRTEATRLLTRKIAAGGRIDGLLLEIGASLPIGGALAALANAA